nr:hypothetical protein [Tanacetum cinerariifolium]
NDKEREMELRQVHVREATPVLQTGSPCIRRYRGRVGEFKEDSNKDESQAKKESGDWMPSEQRSKEGGNLPPNGMYLSHNPPPFIPNSLQPPPNRLMPTYVNPYSQPNASMTYSQPPSYPFHAQSSNLSFRGVSACHPYEGYTQQAPMSNYGPSHNGHMYPLNVSPTSYPFYAQPINPLPNAPMCSTYGPVVLFVDFIGCVNPFVRWIKDYPLSDGLKMPYHVGSYDGKGDPEKYLHLFEGSIVSYEDLKAKFQSHFSQQKKFPKTYLVIMGLHEEQCISGFVHRLKTRILVEFLSTDLPTTYKGLMEKTYTWIEAKEVATNEAPNDHKEGFDKFSKGFSWDNNKGRKKSWDMFSSYKGSNHGLLGNLTKSPREILATDTAAKAIEHPLRMELRHQVKKAVKSGQLAQLVKGIKKGKIIGLHEEQCISGFVHRLKTRILVEFLSTDLPTTYKGLMEKTYTWIEAKEVATNEAPNDHKEGFDKFSKGFSWDNNKGRKKSWDMFSSYKGSNHGLLGNLTKSPREILATDTAAKAIEHPLRMV